jgi:adenylate cyclase
VNSVVLVVISVAGTLLVCAGAYFGVRKIRDMRRPKPPPQPGWVKVVQGAVQAGVRARELAPAMRESFQSLMSLGESVRATDLKSDLGPDGTVTLLFSDIEDSTAINARLGDDRWLDELRAHTKVVEKLVDNHDGHVVKSQGDGFMVAFPEPLSGVHCAIALQKALEQPGRKREALRVRVGLHTGRAISESGDYFGENVAFAARVAQQAIGGEVLVSAAVKERTDEDARLSFSAARTVQLKGIAGTHDIFRVTEGGHSRRN